MSAYAGWPSNVLNPEGRDKVREYVAMTVPQGWAFFTKSPEESEIGVYDARTGETLLVTPQTRVENAFGLSRNQRAQGPELALIASQITDWHECPMDREICFSEASGAETQSVENDAFVRTICGAAFVTGEKPTPWAYRDFDGVQRSQIQQIARVHVSCAEPKRKP
ncbi:SdpA family antimicrobial peptide system protein [Leifsonia aquatica]|uniref:SdpA family antimicrobial peptide system protein n=1 Tax=Leifsonia aquatica TaxID=144185 RepID=UPI001B7FCC43|nr:SdpA family antimicrobial peptide system protein [Leifsonia aquatica]